MLALGLAIASALCFGIALVTGRVGLRSLDARAGAAISVPSAAVMFLLAAPFAIDLAELRVVAVLLFAAVGLFFPAVVTLLTFRANQLLGPTTTGAVSATAPLFAILAAGVLLDEEVPAQAALSVGGVMAGVALLSWRGGVARQGFVGRALLLPVAGAALRGLAQVGAKAGLLIWASPFAAGLIGYLVSAAMLISVNRVGRAQQRSVMGQGAAWFAATGILNGSRCTYARRPGRVVIQSCLGIAPNASECHRHTMILALRVAVGVWEYRQRAPAILRPYR